MGLSYPLFFALTITIYRQYLQAFKKGAYNYIKEEQDPVSKQVMPRKYFSGGVKLAGSAMTTVITLVSALQLSANDQAHL